MNSGNCRATWHYFEEEERFVTAVTNGEAALDRGESLPMSKSVGASTVFLKA